MKFIALLVLLNLNFSTNAQVVMEIPNDGILYWGIENHVAISHNKSNCRKLKIETDNGRLIPYKSCEFIYNAENTGKVQFKIYKKNLFGYKLLQIKDYRVKHILDSTNLHAYLNSHSTFSKVSKAELLISKGIHIRFLSNVHNHNVVVKLKKYDITLVTENGRISFPNQSQWFSEEFLAELDKMKNNDMIIFDNIETTFDDSIIRCNPLVIYVTE